ncbi:MAG: hypothetical protein H7Z41_06090 [Cytophagales bacterium]|nr:hypothetical protein [Armatimonadota bacterium]
MQDPSKPSSLLPESRAPLPVHPALLALASLLSPFVANRLEIPPTDLIRPALVTLATVALIWLLLWVTLRRDLLRSALLTSTITFWLFAYGHLPLLYPLITGIGMLFYPQIFAVNRNLFLFPLWLFVLVFVVTVLIRTRRSLQAPTVALNATAAALLVSALLPLAADRLRVPPSGTETYAKRQREGSIPAGANGTAPQSGTPPPLRGALPTPAAPDIYFIVLDAYGREDVLRQYYGFDNAPFIRQLEEKGFFVASQSRANYNQTVLCLAAALGMRYSDDIGHSQPPNSRNTLPLTDRADRSATAAFLKARGYHYLAVTTGFPLTLASSADILYGNDTTPPVERLTAYESLLIGITPFCLVPRVNRTLYDGHRDALSAAWHHLEAIPTEQPFRKFVYVHLLAPHPPFVFDAQGRSVAPENKPYSLADASDFLRTNPREIYRDGYVKQIQHVNRRTLAALSIVLKKSSTPPIIVLIGDHGPRLCLDYQSLDNTDVRECFGNLFAVYLPGGANRARTLFGDTISPVNSFRLLFDQQFGATFPRLPDRSYYSMPRTPYKVTDVTERTALSAPR